MKSAEVAAKLQVPRQIGIIVADKAEPAICAKGA